MRPDEFQALLRNRPFRPFRIHLSNGLTFDVRHPEMALLGRSLVWIHVPESQGPPAVAEQRWFIVLIHIVYGEFIEPPAPPADGAGADQPPA
jgi:hypothetical protein